MSVYSTNSYSNGRRQVSPRAQLLWVESKLALEYAYNSFKKLRLCLLLFSFLVHVSITFTSLGQNWFVRLRGILRFYFCKTGKFFFITAVLNSLVVHISSLVLKNGRPEMNKNKINFTKENIQTV